MQNPSQHSALPLADGRFGHKTYLVRRRFLKLLGASFYVDDPSGQVVLYADQKAFKLKEDIRLYTGEDKTQEVLRISARTIFDMSAIYDVFDSATNIRLGALQRRGMKSMFRDEWGILDLSEREVGTIVEDSMVLALIRRFVDMATLFMPQKYSVTVQGQDVATFTQTKNPLIMKINLDFSADTQGQLDRRLGIAAGVLLSAIDGKQS